MPCTLAALFICIQQNSHYQNDVLHYTSHAFNFYLLLESSKAKAVRADIDDEDELESYLQYVEDHKVGYWG